MAGLEPLVLGSVGGLILALALVAPVALIVSGSRTSVARAATLEFTATISASIEGAAAQTAASVDGHALAAAVSATASTCSSLGCGDVEAGLSDGLVLLLRLVRCWSAGSGELESGCSSLLLCELSSLLGIGQGQGVSSLMAATGTASTATSRTGVLTTVAPWCLEVSKSRPGSS